MFSSRLVLNLLFTTLAYIVKLFVFGICESQNLSEFMTLPARSVFNMYHTVCNHSGIPAVITDWQTSQLLT